MFYRACFNCPIVYVVFSGLGSDTSSGVHSHCNHVRGLPGPLAGESKVPSQWNASRISLWHYFPGLPAGMSNPDTFIGWNKFNVQSTLKLTVTLTFPQWLFMVIYASQCVCFYIHLKKIKFYREAFMKCLLLLLILLLFILNLCTDVAFLTIFFHLNNCFIYFVFYWYIFIYIFIYLTY